MSSVLSSSKDVAVTTELWYFNYWVNKYSFLSLSNEAQLRFFLNKFLASQRFKYLQINPNDVKEYILSNVSRWNHRSIFRRCIELYRIKCGAVYVGEKTPGQYAQMSHLLSEFPESRVICLIRDPRAIAASLRNTPFGTNYVSYAALRWVSYVEILVSCGAEDDRVLILKYEDFVTDANNELERIKRFMGWTSLEFNANEDRSGSFRGNQEAGWSQSHFNRANARLDRTSIDKWKSLLSKREIQLIEHITGKYLDRFGYELSGLDSSTINTQLNYYVETVRRRVDGLIKKPNKLAKLRAYRQLEYKVRGDISEKN